MNKDLGNDLKTISSSSRARTKKQFEIMKNDEGADTCPFCCLDKHVKKPLKKGIYWALKHNDFPYKHHLFHFVIIFLKHTNDISEVSPGAWAELGEFIQWTIDKFNIPGGGFVMRFGHSDYNSSTIRHLHAHIQVPDNTGPAKATFAKSLEKKKADRAKVAGFEKE